MIRALDAGVSPNIETKDGLTPLHWAATSGGAFLIEFLLIADADIEARTCPDGFTPLHMTVEGESLEEARELLRCGADINARNAYGQTSLRMAVETSGVYEVVSPRMARFLIEMGADLNARDDAGYSIARAAQGAIPFESQSQEAQEIVALLAERGAMLE